MKVKIIVYQQESHNPYFNRWFSAMLTIAEKQELKQMSQSLF